MCGFFLPCCVQLTICFCLVDVSSTVHVLLLDKMADIEYRLASGASEKMQLGALVAVFVKAREMITAGAETMDQ